jgi:hypothetical protein
MFVLLLMLMLNAVGSVIVALPVAVHPLLSVILYEYVPAAKLLGLWVVEVYVPGPVQL